MSDDSGINWTSYGPEDQGTWMADKNSSHGIGAWDNEMTPGQDVAMNAASRAKYNIRAYSPDDPSTKDQWFQANGKWWHYADNVPESYSDARIDVFKGRYDGVPNAHSAGDQEPPISRLPDKLDLASFQPGAETGQAPAENYEAYRQELEANRNQAQQSKSLIDQYVLTHPDSHLSWVELMREMHSQVAPKMPYKDFMTAAQSPDGIKTIKEFNEREKSPLEQLKDKLPKQYKNASDDFILQALYDTKVKDKKIDPHKLSYEEFKWQMKPPTDFVSQADRFLTELEAQAGPKFQSGLLSQWVGIREEEIQGAPIKAKQVLGMAFPGMSDDQLTQKLGQYQKLNDAQRRKQFIADFSSNPANSQAALTAGQDPARLADQLSAAFETLDHKTEYDKFIKTTEKTIGELDSEHQGTLPENQQKVLSQILSVPPLVLTGLFPGTRELGLYGQFYRDNEKAIRAANPMMDEEKVAQKARATTDAQFPSMEVLSLMFSRGGTAAAATITNKILKASTQLAASSAEGGAVFGVNQLIQNVNAGRDPSYGLGEATATGFTFGLVGQGAGLTVKGLAKAFGTAPETRRAMNIASDIVGATPEEANKILAGDPSAEVNQKATRNSVDMILSAHVESLKEKGEIPAWQAAREAEIAQGAPMKAPHTEAIAAAKAARDNGDLATAAAKTDEALAKMPKKEKEKLQANVADAIAHTTKKGERLRNVEASAGYFGIDKPPENATKEHSKLGPRVPHQPIGVIERQGAKDPGDQIHSAWKNLSSKTGRQSVFISDLIKESGLPAETVKNWLQKEGVEKGTVQLDEGDLGAAKGIGKGDFVQMAGRPRVYADLSRISTEGPQDITPGLGSLGLMPDPNPFNHLRATSDWLRSTEGWKKTFDAVSRVFAAQRRGQAAKDTAALVVKTSGWRPFVHMALQAIADDDNLNSVLRRGDKSDRRDGFWQKYSDPERIAMITAKEKGQKLSDPVADKMMDYYRHAYDWLEDLLLKNGVKMGHIDDYLHHSFKNPASEISTFIKDWEHQFAAPGFTKTRHYPTLEDAVAAGLKPKTTNPERNFVAYWAAAINALRQIQALKSMEEEGLAIPSDKVKREDVEPMGWHLVTTPDKKSYWVSDGAYGVTANAFDMKSVYATMGGPFTALSRALKLPTGLKLSWSLFHALHVTGISAADSITEAQQRMVMGKSSPVELLKAIGDAATYGLAGSVTSVKRFGRLVDVLSGKFKGQLTAAEQQDLRDLMEMGIVPHISAERQRAFSSFIFQNRHLGKLTDAAALGYDILSAKPYQEWLFGKVIPSLKIASALRRRDTLLMKYGERLRSTDMNMQRAREFAEINRDVEGRYGEMNYDNLFWRRMAKQVGLAVPLSLGWNLGFWRVYGDGIIDLTRDAANLDRLKSRWKDDPTKVFTNRIAYMANYTAMSMIANGVMTYMLTGGIKNIADYFFPRIGTRKDGQDERVRTPYWTGEWSSMYEHYKEKRAQNEMIPTAGAEALVDYFGNKLNPGLAAVFHYFQNKDFTGRKIVDWNGDNQTKKLTDSVTYFLRDMFLPISVEQSVGEQIGGHGAPTELNQKVWSVLGFSPAAGWASRTDLENQIMSQMLHRDMTPSEAAKYDAKQKFQYALQSKDQDLINKALEDFKASGASHRMIADAIKNANISPSHRAFHALGTEKQLNMMRKMSGTDLEEYWPYATRDAKLQFQQGE